MLGRRRTLPGAGTVLRVAAAVSCLALAGACSDDGKGVSGATVPTAGDATTTSTAPTTTVPPSYDVPETIDQAYVQRVVSAYDKVLGDAIRVLKRDGVINEEFLNHLLAIYTADEFEFQHEFWAEAVDKGVLQKYRDDPGDPKAMVIRLLRADQGCLVAEIDDNYLEVLRPGEDPSVTPQDDYLVFVPKSPGRDPLQANMTPWVAAFAGYKTDNSEPIDACDG